MPGGMIYGEQVGELAVGIKAVHCCLEVEHLDNGKVFVKFLSVCRYYNHI